MVIKMLMKSRKGMVQMARTLSSLYQAFDSGSFFI